jgi:hypothetical protein
VKWLERRKASLSFHEMKEGRGLDFVQLRANGREAMVSVISLIRTPYSAELLFYRSRRRWNPRIPGEDFQKNFAGLKRHC